MENSYSKINPSRFYNLHQYGFRKKSELFLILGKKYIELAIKFGLKPILYSIYEIENYQKITSYEMKKITGNVFTTEVGICKKFTANFDFSKPFLVCDNVLDHGNLGSILRTAYSFNFQNIICILDEKENSTNDLYYNKITEASRGLIFAIQPIVLTSQEVVDLFVKHNISIINVDLKGDNINEWKPVNSKFALIFGNESEGISENLKLNQFKSINIPTKFESLNVSVAVGIILQHVFANL